jgi:hypothetical protein
MLYLKIGDEEIKVDMTFNIEDLCQTDLYRLVLVCKNWNAKYQKYLDGFRNWLRVRANILNIFVKFYLDMSDSYLFEDILFGPREIIGNKLKPGFEREIARTEAAIAGKQERIILHAERVSGCKLAKGDLVIINCYKLDMVLIRYSYYYDGTSFVDDLAERIIDGQYPPYYGGKRTVDRYKNREIKIKPGKFISFGMLFPTGDDMGRWNGYGAKEKVEKPAMNYNGCRNMDYKFIKKEFYKSS